MRSPYKKSGKVYGMGINDADYVTCVNEYYKDENGKVKQRCVWRCPIFATWVSMIYRLTPQWIKMHPTYYGCMICDEWLYFSNFKTWMENQDWQGKDLDKDLLSKSGKLYSPETCAFIPQALNKFFTEGKRSEKNKHLPIGAYPIRGARYMSKVLNVFSGKVEYLGYFNTPEEAHGAWLKKKLELALLWVEHLQDERVIKALIDRYENYGEIK